MAKVDFKTFITVLDAKFKTNEKLKEQIPNNVELIKALNDLNEIVGLNDIKASVLLMLKTIIMSKVSDKNFDMYLHTIITGSPGVGKTSLANVLARIWCNSGAIVDKSKADLGKIQSKDNDQRVDDKFDCNYLNDPNLSSIGLDKPIMKLFAVKKENDKDAATVNTKEEEKEDENKSQTEKLEDADYLLMKCLMRLSNLPDEDANSEHKNNIEDILDARNSIGDVAKNIDKIKFKININPKDKEIFDRMSPLNFLMSLATQSLSDDTKSDQKKTKDNFLVVRREDLVGEYMGQTSVKTKRCLEKALGGVLFIDEAYTLYNPNYSNGDSYGLECLTLINEFMSLHKDELVVIMSGYKNLIEEGPFKGQPGLKRRFQWNFNIEDYSAADLLNIFKKQIKDCGLTYDKCGDLEKLFKNNKSLLKNNGGDTLRLAQKCKQMLISSSYDSFMESDTLSFNDAITDDIVKDCFGDIEIKEDKNDHMISMFM